MRWNDQVLWPAMSAYLLAAAYEHLSDSVAAHSPWFWGWFVLFALAILNMVGALAGAVMKPAKP